MAGQLEQKLSNICVDYLDVAILIQAGQPLAIVCALNLLSNLNGLTRIGLMSRANDSYPVYTFYIYQGYPDSEYSSTFHAALGLILRVPGLLVVSNSDRLDNSC